MDVEIGAIVVGEGSVELENGVLVKLQAVGPRAFFLGGAAFLGVALGERLGCESPFHGDFEGGFFELGEVFGVEFGVEEALADVGVWGLAAP